MYISGIHINIKRVFVQKILEDHVFKVKKYSGSATKIHKFSEL